MVARAALSIWWALRTLPCRGPNPSVDRRLRWIPTSSRAPGWEGAPDGQQAKKISCYKMFILLRTSVSCLPVNAALMVASVSTPALVVPPSRLSTVGDRAFPVAAARVWNSLPDFVTASTSLPMFKRHLKTVLFAKSY